MEFRAGGCGDWFKSAPNRSQNTMRILNETAYAWLVVCRIVLPDE
jgi:hypothetical protein